MSPLLAADLYQKEKSHRFRGVYPASNPLYTPVIKNREKKLARGADINKNLPMTGRKS